MTETGQTSNAAADCVFKMVREGFERLADAFTPPEAASKHFREARIEMLRGARELIDHRIDRLSRNQRQGTRVVVE